MDVDYDRDRGDSSLDGLPPMYVEHEFQGVADNPDERELETLTLYEDADQADDAIDEREDFNWWTRFKRIYRDEHKKLLSGMPSNAAALPTRS